MRVTSTSKKPKEVPLDLTFQALIKNGRTYAEPSLDENQTFRVDGTTQKDSDLGKS